MLQDSFSFVIYGFLLDNALLINESLIGQVETFWGILSLKKWGFEKQGWVFIITNICFVQFGSKLNIFKKGVLKCAMECVLFAGEYKVRHVKK